MATIINKKEKRRCIALSCMNLITNSCIKDLTISELAKEANVGKGTIYEYFLDKEDIILELTQALYEEYKYITTLEINKLKNSKDKIYYSFNSLYSNKFDIHRKVLNIFMGICHYRDDISYKRFKKKLYKERLILFINLVNKGVEQKILKENTKDLAKILLNSFSSFFVIFLFYRNTKKITKEINRFLDYIMK